MVTKLSIYYWIHLVLILSTVLLWFFPDEVIGFHVPRINREFGFLEHAQLIIVGLCTIVLIQHSIISKINWLRLVIMGLIGFSIFVFLEEIDYGLHYYDWYMGYEPFTSNFDGIRNIHNDYSLSKTIMQTTNKLVLFGFMIVAPFMANKFGKYKKYLPTTIFAWSLISFRLINFAFKKLPPTTVSKELLKDTQYFSEMWELMIYYIWFLYLVHLYRVRQQNASEPTYTKLNSKSSQAQTSTI